MIISTSSFSIHAFLTLIWLIAYFSETLYLGIIVLSCQYVYIFVSHYKDKVKNFSLIMFEICTFIFTEGSLICSAFDWDGTILEGVFNDEISMHIVSVIYLGQLFTVLGYDYKSRKMKHTKYVRFFNAKSQNIKIIKKVSFWLLLLSFIPKAIISYMTSKFQVDVGYTDAYILDSNISNYSILFRLSTIYEITLWIFLMCKPSKLEVYGILSLNVLISLLQSFGGHRTPIIMAFVMTMTYLFYRNNIDQNRKWLSGNWITMAIIILPIVIYCASTFAYYREGLTNQNNLVGTIKEFFKNSSANIIGYERLYSKMFPKTTNFIFGPLVLMLRSNTLFRMFTNSQLLKNQTADMALSGLSLGQTITYLVMPWDFRAGGGMGSSYYAEAFCDFGYMGVIMFSFLLGILLYSLFSIQSEHVLFNAVLFMGLRALFSISRAEFFGFIAGTFTPTNITVCLFISLIAKYHSNEGRKTVIHMGNKNIRAL